MKKLKKIFEELLDEDLTYSHASTEGVEDDEYEIGKILPEGEDEDDETSPMVEDSKV